ncbi:tRNA glutamyl-Q(34) synthetase GluQRS [Sandarakinorhabdus sp. DWP1-3-1]|uniref:tRNA glutamyl-Q(34) synthetase GluQRS n=1 Tax=Sandarakinorhabdus sp. DWP1-3-1 TaxID=2804627 RepID=UPI003CE79318
MYVTRFAPSPTGPLHLGNALSAYTGWTRARNNGGTFLLRIEDIDTSRCRPEHEAAARADLAWLGLDWDGTVLRQSERGAVYAWAIARLRVMGLEYPCFCSRADIAAAASAPHGPDGPIYPGTCRHLSDTERSRRMAGEAFAWRLDVAAALAITGPLTWHDSEAGPVHADPAAGGDVVVGRKAIGVSYHLAVVVDDAAQSVTEVVRGADLFEATHVQRLLQALLGLPTPSYHHHPLLTDSEGRRLAKRDGAPTLAALRAAGVDPAAVRSALDAARAAPATPWRLGEFGLPSHL